MFVSVACVVVACDELRPLVASQAQALAQARTHSVRIRIRTQVTAYPTPLPSHHIHTLYTLIMYAINSIQAWVVESMLSFTSCRCWLFVQVQPHRRPHRYITHLHSRSDA